MGSTYLFEWILMTSLDLLVLNSKKVVVQSRESPHRILFGWWSSLGASLQGHGFLQPMIWKHWNYRWPAVNPRRRKKAFLRVFEHFLHFFWIPEIDVFNLSCVVLTYYYRYTCCNLQFGSMARKTPPFDAVTYQSFTSSSLRVLENPLEGGSRLYQMILE